MGVTSQLDLIVARLLFVDVQPNPDTTKTNMQRRAERVFGLSLLFSGVRCVLQYVVLPFVLPLLGIASDAAVPLMLGISILAVLSIIVSLRRFWSIGYSYRWHYLVVAMVAISLLCVFIVLDLNKLLST